MITEKRYSKGHFTAIGIAIGLPIGIPIGLAMGNIALGLTLGLPIGIAIGATLEKKYNINPIEPTLKEKVKKQKIGWIAMGFGIVSLLISTGFYFFLNS